MIKNLLAFLCSLFLFACTAPQFEPFVLNIPSSFQPLRISDVNVESHVKKFDLLPHIENKMPISPLKALTEWAEKVFIPTSKNISVKLVVVIEDAYMTQINDHSENWYKLDNVLYKLSYKIVLKFMTDQEVIYTQNIQGWESSSIPERSSLADKEATWKKMMNNMLYKVNQKALNDIPLKFKQN